MEGTLGSLKKKTRYGKKSYKLEERLVTGALQGGVERCKGKKPSEIFQRKGVLGKGKG